MANGFSGSFSGVRSLAAVSLALAAAQVQGKAAKADPFLHAAIARAIAEVDEMELTHRATFDELMGYAERGEPVPMERRALFAYQSSSVVRRMADLVDDMVKLLGGRAVYMSSPILQPWLDILAARAHVANDPGNRTSDVIMTRLGEPPAFTFV